jgi:hypothetical protein
MVGTPTATRLRGVPTARPTPDEVLAEFGIDVRDLALRDGLDGDDGLLYRAGPMEHTYKAHYLHERGVARGARVLEVIIGPENAEDLVRLVDTANFIGALPCTTDTLVGCTYFLPLAVAAEFERTPLEDPTPIRDDPRGVGELLDALEEILGTVQWRTAGETALLTVPRDVFERARDAAEQLRLAR